LLVQLGRDVSVLVFCEAQLAASRNMPEVRRAARDIAGALVVAIAFLTAFVFANLAAFEGLTNGLSAWLAALVLGAAWLAIGAGLVVALMVRAGNVTGWRWWRVFSAGGEETSKELERARAQAEQAVRETLAQLAPAISVEIATAAVPIAGDMAGDVVEAGFSGSRRQCSSATKPATEPRYGEAASPVETCASRISMAAGETETEDTENQRLERCCTP
jgi:hypothetical protein